MGRALAHRGPDSGGTHVRPAADGAPRTGFAFRRLAIIDTSVRGNQPMQIECQACGVQRDGALVFMQNGEIYNFQELRAELQASGHCFKSSTDTEVAIHLYAQYGPSFASRLNGMFAMAILDNRDSGRPAGVEKGDLILVRDHLGVKPLYWTESSRGVAFASEMKALLSAGMVDGPDVDPVALHYHLAYLWCPAPRTIVRGVRKLRPGSMLRVRGGRVITETEYYRPPFGEAPPDDSRAGAVSELRHLIRSGVNRQLVSDVPVGAFLSGGVDSSAVVAAARLERPELQIPTYCIGFGGDAGISENDDDLPFARIAADHLGVALHSIVVGPGLIDRLDEMQYWLDEPQADPAPINALIVAETARAMGVKVLLSGTGGDDIFSGYRRHQAVRFERYWSWLPRPARELAERASAAIGGGRSFANVHAAPVRRLAKLFAYSAHDQDRRLVSYLYWSSEALRRGLYSADMAATLTDVDTAAPLLESLHQLASTADPLARMLALETRYFLADHNLNYMDRAGMAVGVEVRVPLLDLDLVNYGARIASSTKMFDGQPKALFKEAVAPWLPISTVTRPKSGFGAPLRRWLTRELKPLVGETLGDDAIRSRGWFNPKAIAELVRLDQAQRVDASYTILQLMCLELWARRTFNK